MAPGFLQGGNDMSDSITPAVEGFVRFKKVAGKHHMYCPVRDRKVVLGPNQADGDIAYLTPAGSPAGSNESWVCLDEEGHVAEATEQEMQETAGEPEGTLEIKEVGEEAYDVVNTETGKPLNTSALSKEEAEALVAGSPEEKKGLLARLKDKVTGGDKNESGSTEEGDGIGCPYGHEFGKDHDDHDECDECEHAPNCEGVKQNLEG
jgi:hypothetical protein